MVELTLSDDQGWVEQKVSHQLCSQLVEEATGDRAVKNRVLVLYHVHKRDGWGPSLLGHTLDLRINTQNTSF